MAAAIRAERHNLDLVVLGGGDGTMNAAAEALVEAGLPLGVLPLGTANDLARTLRIPRDPAAAARVIVEGRTRAVDLGRANDKLFFNVASIGLSVRVARHMRRSGWKARFGALSYPLTVWRVLREAHSFKAEIEIDGSRERLRTIQLAVGNGRFYGGGMAVDEEAEIDDGLLHLYALKPQPLWKLILRARAFRSGRHDDPSAVHQLRRPRHLGHDASPDAGQHGRRADDLDAGQVRDPARSARGLRRLPPPLGGGRSDLSWRGLPR